MTPSSPQQLIPGREDANGDDIRDRNGPAAAGSRCPRLGWTLQMCQSSPWWERTRNQGRDDLGTSKCFGQDTHTGSPALSGKQEAVCFGSHGANLEGRARGRGPDPGEPRAVPSQRRAGPEPYVRKPIWKMVRRGLKGWGVDRPGDLLGDLKQPRHAATGTRM